MSACNDVAVTNRPIVMLLHGPNLNLLGQREPAVYGTATIDDYVTAARAEADRHGLDLEHFQCFRSRPTCHRIVAEGFQRLSSETNHGIFVIDE